MAGFQRYAVYFAPRRDSVLGCFGAAWLGWDAERGVDCEGLEVDRLPRPRAELVATPRKYGFHGTLKAPFRLADGATPEAVEATLREVAARFAPFAEPMQLSALGPFLALTPAVPGGALGAVADACVTAFDPLRAPALAGEIAKRREQSLTSRQEAHLAEWGYPYVFEDFRFHLTLTGALSPEDQAATAAALRPVLASALAAPTPFEDLCVFGEAADGRFHLLRRRTLGREAARP